MFGYTVEVGVHHRSVIMLGDGTQIPRYPVGFLNLQKYEARNPKFETNPKSSIFK